MSDGSSGNLAIKNYSMSYNSSSCLDMSDTKNSITKNSALNEKEEKKDFLEIGLSNSPNTNNNFDFLEKSLEDTPKSKEYEPNKFEFKIAPESDANAIITDYDPSKNISGENADFFYVNGILTNKGNAKNTANIISQITNKNVTAIWSKKESVFNDLIKAIKIDQANNTGTLSSETASEISLKVINSLKNGKNVKIIAHSRGASETANALWDVRSRLAVSGHTTDEINKLISKVEVVTMGGLATPSDFPSDIKLIQMRNPDDPVPKLNEDKLKSQRRKFSKTELDIQKKVTENQGKPLSMDEKEYLYKKNIDSDKIEQNVKDKVSTALKVFYPEINTATSVSGGAFAGRVILKKLPKKGLSLATFTAHTSASLAGKGGIGFVVKDSKIVGVSLSTKKVVRLQSGFTIKVIKPLVSTAFKISPAIGAKSIGVVGKFGIQIASGNNNNIVDSITVGNKSRRAVLDASSKISENIGKTVKVVPISEIKGGIFIKSTANAFNTSMKLINGSSKLAVLDAKILINPKTIAITGAVVVGSSISYALKKLGSSHLINAGSSNYLGEKSVQSVLKKEAS